MQRKISYKQILFSTLLFTTIISSEACSKSGGSNVVTPPSDTVVVTPPPALTPDVSFWLTKGDQSVLLQKQTTVIGFTTTANTYSNITIDTRRNTSL